MRCVLSLCILLMVAGCDAGSSAAPMPARFDGPASGDGKLHVTFFEVGSSEATLIVSPTGRSVLVGSGTSAARNALAIDVGTRTKGTLDLYVAREPDPDGLAALRRAMKVVRRIAVEGWDDPDQLAVSRGDVDLGGGAKLTFVGDVGVRVTHGASSILVLHSPPREDALPPSTLLRAPLSAGPQSIGAAALAQIAPEFVVVSVGPGNELAAPDGATLRLFNAEGAHVLRTDLDGSIEVIGDGERLSITPSRAVAGAREPMALHFPPAAVPESEEKPVEAASAQTAPAPEKTFRPRYLGIQGDPHFHMPDCRAVSRAKRDQLRPFRSRVEAARKLKPAPDCNP